ncbi:MAG: universal stress protein [Haloarculaceae archaeon]
MQIPGSTYDDVLVPTDGSDPAERAVDRGLAVADRHDATVHALFVVDEARYGATPALSSYELALEQVEERGESLTADVAGRARDRGLDATTVVTRGHPHEEITDYAERQDVDLVVLARVGGGHVESPHLGSTTDRVVRTTGVPVFIA